MKTIAAIATPLFTSALHIIRISGPDTFSIVNNIIKRPLKIKGYTIQHNQIIDNNNIIIDDVLLNIFVKPHSFTGEDSIEINCHGNPLITKQILDLLVLKGCEYAGPGEFSMQAMLNRKMNYFQIEAMNNFINAKNLTSTNLSFNAMMGHQLDQLINIKESIFKITGSIEVNIDYPEYDDVPQYTNKEIVKILEPIIVKLNKIYLDSKLIEPIFNGLKIAIIGSPNVGKSSLLNLLCKQEKAIVSERKGTTRDIIETEINFDGITLRLLDTAGIHETNDEIEKIGIEKTKQVINQADLIIWLVDNSVIQTNDQVFNALLIEKKYVQVNNKSDLKKVHGMLNISVKNGDIQELLLFIKKEISSIKLPDNILVMQSERQISLLNKILYSLNNLIDKLSNNEMLDLLQSDFEAIIFWFNQILGTEFEYDKLNELFKNFCLGK